MQILPERHNIIIVGGWNVRVFNAAWAAQSLFELPEIGLEVSLDDPTHDFRVRGAEQTVQVAPDRLVFTTENPTDDQLHALQALAVKTLTSLSATPVKALGINFAWEEPEPPRDLLELFEFADNRKLADAGARIAETTLKRTLVVDDRVLNLALRLQESGSVTFDLNFHHPLESTTQAVNQLQVGVVGRRDRALEILRNTYPLEE